MNHHSPDSSFDSTDVDTLAESLLADPFGPATTGVFFRRNDPIPSVLDRFERLGDEGADLVLITRHLPTPEVVAAIGERFGSRGEDACRSWLEAWSAFCEGTPQEMAATTKYKPPLDDDNNDRDGVGVAREIASTMRADADVPRLVKRLSKLPRKDAPVRHWTQHALEDAAAMTAAFGIAGLNIAFYAPSRSGYSALLQRRRPTPAAPADESQRPPYDFFNRNSYGSTGRRHRLFMGFHRTVPYWGMRSFLSVCRRTVVVTENGLHASLAVLDMARQGRAAAFLKNTNQKGGTWTVSLDGVNDVNDAFGAIAAAIGPELTELISERSDDVAHMLVQDFVPFSVEHRFFVVDWKIACSTSSDRSLSVLDRRAGRTGFGRLDPRVAELASPPGPVGAYDRGVTTSVEDRALVASMARRVRELLRAMKNGAEGDDTAARQMARAFVVDVGSVGHDLDTVDVIEINSFRCAGFYAADIRLALAALARKPQGGAED